ncbi:MAG TPA: TrmH family RNA methyltransferase, partial [Chitinophagaceae bacterium]|nr:TrmH family RNA methyltransferase [Chitinophagaceae bacterium]
NTAAGLYELDLTQKTALVFGNEHTGVSDEIRLQADGNFIIPQQGMIQSLNISVACAVCLYEAYRQKFSAGHYENEKVIGDERAAIWKTWSENNDR